ncbi:MAG: PIG-L deacetylase family protein [Candidatus Flexifilum sp.]|jgi:LmbE family N-acetylglucosaminyl deacetylase
MTQTILVFSPHFDDESIGCGGSIARHTAAGDRVVVVFVTRGDTGNLMPGFDLDASANERVRKAEAAAALAILGVHEAEYLDQPDGFLRWEAKTVQLFIRLIRQYRPHLVYAPHGAERHTDHRAVYEMVHDALPRASWSIFPDLGREPWYVPEARYYEVWTPIQQPNLLIDITPYAETKRAAIDQYASQLAAVPYHEAMLGLNRYRGAMTATGVQFAEAFVQAAITTL